MTAIEREKERKRLLELVQDLANKHNMVVAEVEALKDAALSMPWWAQYVPTRWRNDLRARHQLRVQAHRRAMQAHRRAMQAK
jgi:hypothetical protein